MQRFTTNIISAATAAAVAVAIAVIGPLTSGALHAQAQAQRATPSDPAFESARRAAAVLDRGIAALGGLDALQAMRGFSLTERGTQTQIGQSLVPEPPYSSIDIEDTTLFDRQHRRVFVDSRRGYVWGAFQQVGFVDGPKAQGFLIADASRSARPISSSEQQPYYDRARRLPQLVLLAARERAHTLRDLGEQSSEGRPHQVISANLGGGPADQSYMLYFDRVTHLLTKIAYLYPDSLFGDTIDETLFTGYHPQGPFTVPAGRTIRRAGQVFEQTAYTALAIDPAFDDARFAVPAGYTMRPAEARPRSEVRQLAKDVYVLEQIDGSGSNAMFVAFDDYLLVIEAPEERIYRGLSDIAIRTIRETVPGKPIRYVVPSHHHVDHGVGLRSYIAEGVTIVTTPGNVAFVRDLAKLQFAIEPDALARHPRTPVIEIIENKRRTFRDASHVVELHDVGPETHVKETVGAWLPNERILFVADLLETGYGDRATWDGKGQLGDILSRYKWEVDTLVTAHSRPRKMADLRPAS
jgi:glyoxylase-like metal-dependent hydrolase (beta-lactamase superfamily II)